MKTLLALILLSCSLAQADEWDTTDKALAATALTAEVMDWHQTREIAHNPQSFHELNPILGQHPSVRDVNRYFIGSIAATYLLADALPENWRKMFLAGAATVEIGVVAHNYHIGLGSGF